MRTPEEEINRKLANVDHAARGGLREMRFFTLRKVVGGIAVGVGACALVVVALEMNKPRAGKAPPPKPVSVQILPGK